jgi:hypothetical protein
MGELNYIMMAAVIKFGSAIRVTISGLLIAEVVLEGLIVELERFLEVDRQLPFS